MVKENSRRRRARRSGCSRNQEGGGTQSYGFGPDVGPRGAGVGAAEVVTQQYVNVPRFGTVTPAAPTGLPFGSTFMRGGRFSTDVGDVLAADAGVAAPVITRLPPCVNDPNAAAKIWPARGGSAPVTMNPMLRESTAGYAFGVDGAQSGAGTPITIQVPFDARSASPNCTSVKGGARRRSSAPRAQSKRRKAKKSRKTQRRRRANRN